MTFSRGNAKAARLTAMQVMDMRAKYASGDYTYERLSREFQVTPNTVRNVVLGLTWQRMPRIEHEAAIDERMARTAYPPVVDEETLKARMLARLAEPQAKFVIPPLEDDTNSAVLDKLTRAIARETAPDTALGELLDGGQKGDST